MQARSQDAVAKQFIGVWRLVSTEQRMADGTTHPSPAFGPNGVGYLMYSDAKRMCAVLMNPARPQWVVPSNPTEQEVRSAMNGLVAYCGTYDVDAGEGSVVHHVELDTVPNTIGTDRKRFFTITGNRLVLRLAPPLPEGVLESSLTRERVKN